MLNKDLEVTLNLAFQQARDSRHEYMTVEHLLLALIDNPSAYEALIACGADVNRLREEVANFIQQTTPIIAESTEERETQPTLGFQRVLQRAVFHVQSSGRNEVSGANVLVAIFSEQESQAVYLLRRCDITRLDVVNFISHGMSKEDDSGEPQDQELIDDQSEHAEDRSMLAQFAANLNQLAQAGSIDPLIGRYAEIERAIQTFCLR
ncbi:ATP-dependent Clp protease ATP-binding subunit ClpA, partial [Shewanella sp. SR41-2]|nr:ATP-dependent Clp protease ATP-binding subunit ClpA [Shewanella sp. SR41-2]